MSEGNTGSIPGSVFQSHYLNKLLKESSLTWFTTFFLTSSVEESIEEFLDGSLEETWTPRYQKQY